MKKAKFIKDVPGGTGEIKLYELTPPLEDEDWDGKKKKHKYVVVSATCGSALFPVGPETYIFPSNKNGKTTNMSELEGSYKGGLSHETALANAGYTVK